jgi:hypothetical protein
MIGTVSAQPSVLRCYHVDDSHEALFGRHGEVDRQRWEEAYAERVVVPRFANVERMRLQLEPGRLDGGQERRPIRCRIPGCRELRVGTLTPLNAIAHRCFADSASSARISAVVRPPRSAARRRISSQEIVGGSGPAGGPSVGRMNPLRISDSSKSRETVSVSTSCPTEFRTSITSSDSSATRILSAVSGSTVVAMTHTSRSFGRTPRDFSKPDQPVARPAAAGLFVRLFSRRHSE